MLLICFVNNKNTIERDTTEYYKMYFSASGTTIVCRDAVKYQK